MVSYQVMSTEKDSVKLLAVAIPKVVLEEYESAVLAAGYLPGAVLPSTLAALAGVDQAEGAVVVVDAGLGAVTAAVVEAGGGERPRLVRIRGRLAAASDREVPLST